MVRSVENRACAHCAGPIARVPVRGPLPTYCGSACRWAAGHKRDSDRRRGERSALTCEGCGAGFSGGKRKNRFCSPGCCQRRRRKVSQFVSDGEA
ncbi:hypothetical protein J8F10_30450 [Gemmata sp. G18]|uniref:Uncharacterized protein n=1 Tax=Gemmata palustris TaxID=2822762 RepID=A0ABS5C0S5_9BACT|nr:hypothetical protein [Gemmata palustris]MBP3959587.1 hypothetical protein [Gemmata palustris]